MKVFKFGGTSVGSPENMRSVMNIITDGEPKIVVLSAMSGTTNTLVEISDFLYKGLKDDARRVISELKNKYLKVVDELYKSDEYKAKGADTIETHFSTLYEQTQGDEFGATMEQVILAQGELISTALVTFLLNENGHRAELLPSLEFMRINADKQADLKEIKSRIKPILEVTKSDIYITQGFICRNIYDDIDNLQRGGSDYTATLIGAAIGAEEVQIWTDIDGFHNNDPRFVDKTERIDNLLFIEAAELAYFGAKILHPSTVLPAKDANIPVRLKNTMNPDDPGTLISNKKKTSGLKAVAAKDGITAIKIRSDRMLMAYGFLRAVFGVFEKYKTSIDMITTSEVAVSLTIDNNKFLDNILEELEEFGDTDVDEKQTIVCVVGDMASEEKVFAKNIFDALEGIPVRMISYGGSQHNVSILIPERFKKETLQKLSDNLFH